MSDAREEYLRRLLAMDPGPKMLHDINEVAAEFGVDLSDEGQAAEREAFEAEDRRLEVRGAWFGGFALGALVTGLVIAVVLLILTP